MPLTKDEKLLTLSRNIIEGFDKVDGGIHPGFRPAHAKGILLTGIFTPSSEAASLTRAPHMQRASTPVMVRFSDFAGIPTVRDNDPQGASPRGCAIRFRLAEHVHTDIVAHSVDAFPSRTAEGLLDFLNARTATDPAGPHPNAIEQFLGTHPAALTFVQIPKPIPTSFAKESFFAVSAFKFTNANGVSRYGRYRELPVAGNEYLDVGERPRRLPTSCSTRSKSGSRRGQLSFASLCSWLRTATPWMMPLSAGLRIVRSLRWENQFDGDCFEQRQRAAANHLRSHPSSGWHRGLGRSAV